MDNECIDTIANVFSAIGTVGSVVAALYFASADSRSRENEEKRKQATSIAGWVGGDHKATMLTHDENKSILTLVNNSNLPVFNLIAIPVLRQAEAIIPLGDFYQASSAKIKVFPPGKYLVYIGYLDAPMGGKEFTLEISFKDSSGNSWIRRANGRLEELNADPLDHYEIERPFSSTTTEEI